MGSTRMKALALAALLLLAAGLGWRWRHSQQAQVQAQDQWFSVLDEDFAPGATAHAKAWDDLWQPAMDGGIYAHSWLHATLAKRPRGPFRMQAQFQAAPGLASRWLELISASPVEYFQDDSHGTSSPRSRYAGCFGRVDLGDGHATLTVGQMGLDGKGRRVVARRVEMNTQGALPALELGLFEDRLTLRFGSNDVSTLADQIPSRLNDQMSFGLRGERCKISRLSVQALTPTAEDAGLREVETYLALGRHDQALPALAEMAALSATPRIQMRLARAYEQAVQPEKAAEIWPSLTDTAKAGFYAGYAQLELLRARAQNNADPLTLDSDLARLSSNLGGHPVVPQLLLLRAHLLAQGGTGIATARGLAEQALSGSNPEASAEALAMLSEGPLALGAADLRSLLDQVAAARPSSYLEEMLALKRAELNVQMGDLPALVANAQASQVLSYGTRKKVYDLLAPLLTPSNLKRQLGTAAEDGSWLRDYLFVRRFPQARARSSQARQLVATDQAVFDLLHGLTRLPKASKAVLGPFYSGKSSKASAYGQLGQGELADDGQGGLCLDFVSGAYWGCGIAIPGDLTDLSSARTLNAKVQAPKGVEYYFTLSEDGVANPDSFSFAGKDGADGEHYQMEPRVGTGDWEDLHLALSQATLSLTWGDPDGNRLLDLQAIQKIDFAIPGYQGTGRVCIKDIHFN